MNHHDISTQVKILIVYTMLHSYLKKYQRNDEIFMVYDHENVVENFSDKKRTQCNNVGPSSQSYD